MWVQELKLLLEGKAPGRRRRRRNVPFEAHARNLPRERPQLKLKVVVDVAHVVKEGK